LQVAPVEGESCGADDAGVGAEVCGDDRWEWPLGAAE
jgi:hypothetical protein